MRLGEIVKSELIDLHRWRESYNGDHVGLGYDEYCRTQQLHYPEAYAKFGTGYIALYEVTEDERWLLWVNRCARWLLENTSLKNCHCWGLPFEYRCVPAGGPYLLTTAFCGDFLCKAFKVTGIADYLEAARSAARWMLENLERKDGNGRLFLSYAPFECLDHHIYNATSIAVKFLASLGEFEDSYLKVADELVKTLLALQRYDGSWFYSENNCTIDCLHTAYVLEGLINYARAVPSKEGPDLKDAIWRGTHFLISRFFSKEGRAKWRYLLGLRDLKDADAVRVVKDMVLRMIDKIHLLKRILRAESRFPECYLWGYAATLRVLALVDGTHFKDLIRNIVLHLITNLKSPEGFFWYNSLKRECYIRHQSHLFEAFATVMLEVA